MLTKIEHVDLAAETRGMMFRSSHSHNCGLCLASALALLVAVMMSPIRPSCGPGGLAHPDCLRRNFGIPSGHSPTSPSKSSAVRVVAPVKAIRSENRGKAPRRVVCLVRLRQDLPSSSSSSAHQPSVEPLGSGPVYQPLRC